MKQTTERNSQLSMKRLKILFTPIKMEDLKKLKFCLIKMCYYNFIFIMMTELGFWE